MKKITVIIPCYNAIQWLPRCFVSLAQQTFGMEDMELIFVDDASTDHGQTWEMLQQFERAYPESVLIIQLQKNMRQGGARNVALQYASGEYIAFVDADDFVTEDFLEKVYEQASEEDADIVQFDFFYYTDKIGKIASDRRHKYEVCLIQTVEERKKLLVEEKITYGCWNKLYRRKLVEKARVKFAEHVMYEEPLFVYPLLFYANKFVIMEDSYYFYRQNEIGTMRKDLNVADTLQMHAAVQMMVWKFMKQTEMFQLYYEEIKMYFLHTYFYETLYFAKLREFQISMDFYCMLKENVQKEVPDYTESKYERILPLQMELYRMAEKAVSEEELDSYLCKIGERRK